jgi:hypothetical protein
MVAIGLALAGCGLIKAKPSDIFAADFGPKPTQEEVLSSVKSDMSRLLFDPYSAVYECGLARKAWANLLGTIHFGWVAFCEINAKNRFGGYVGVRPYGFMINYGRVTLDGWANLELVD